MIKNNSGTKSDPVCSVKPKQLTHQSNNIPEWLLTQQTPRVSANIPSPKPTSSNTLLSSTSITFSQSQVPDSNSDLLKKLQEELVNTKHQLNDQKKKI